MNLSPSSLYDRFLLMILLPIIIIQIVTIVIFYERHWENVSNNIENYLIQEIHTIVHFCNKYKFHNKIFDDLAYLGFEISLLDYKNTSISKTDKSLMKLQAKIDKFIRFNTQLSYTNGLNNIVTLVYLPKNKILKLIFATKRINNPTTYIFVIWILTIFFLFVLISLFFMRNQVQSITKLNKAAIDFGQGKVFNFTPSRVKEIRSLGFSFLKMRKKILRQIQTIQNRTELLAHIAHDLRTPITRIGLKLSLIKSTKDVKIINDNIQQIEDMIENYLTFAKEEENEKNQRCDLLLMMVNIIKLINDKRIKFINHSNGVGIHLYVKKNAIERAFNNVIDNSLKYCAAKVQITLNKRNNQVIFKIEDDGPGISQDKYTKAFEPFNKLDSKIKQGYGLGLAISQNIVTAHGGNIFLIKANLVD